MKPASIHINPAHWYRVRDLEELLGAELASAVITYAVRVNTGAFGRDVAARLRVLDVAVQEVST